MLQELKISTLAHTWIIDVDGTICVHNGYKNGEDKILPGVKDFFSQIPTTDMILILTSRPSSEKENLIRFLNNNELRYNQIIFDAPMGERILINDNKPSGLKMAYAVSKQRDKALELSVALDKDL